MTLAELQLAVNTLLASGQPITALIHRNAAGQIMAEMYNAASRGAVIAGVNEQVSLDANDDVFIVRSGALYRASKDLFLNVNGGTP
jgi:hypothetical protein